MPAPIPVVTPIDTFLDLPVGGNVPLSCAGSTALPGATYQWQLIEAPEGSSATLQNATTTTPTLTNVDTRGTYIVFLVITDSGGSSHPQPYPVQSTSLPYGFSTPLATAFGVVRVAESPSGLVKPGRGEYGWFENGLWPIIDKVNNGLTFNRYDEPTRTLTANAVLPDATILPVNELNLNGLRTTSTETAVILTEADGGQIYIASETIVTGTDLSVIGGILKVDEITDASGGDLRLVPNAELLLYGSTATRIESPDVFVTADTTVTVDADAAVQVTAGTDITLTATGTDGDIALRTEGATGNISLATEGANADILVTTEGIDADISLTTTGATASISLNAKDDLNLTTSGDESTVALSATGASSNITLTAANGVTITSTGDTSSADITLTSGKDVAAYATGLARLSGTTTEVIGASQLALVTDDGNLTMNIGGDEVNDTVDRAAQLTFSTDNKRRIIDLDGYVAQRNHRLTYGGTATQVTPNGVLTFVPFRNNVTADYTYEALCGSSPTLDFVLAFRASFIITQFTTTAGNYFTIVLRCGLSPLAPATTVTLAGFTFQPGGDIEVTDQPCIVSGTIHSTGSKSLYTSGTASLQLNTTSAITQLAADTVDASVALDDGATSLFTFFAISNDSNAIIANLSASFTLMRGS